MRPKPRSRVPVFLLAGTAFVCWTAEAVGIRLNLTPSMPLGFYRLGRSDAGRGDLVAACLPESVGVFGRTRGYLRPGRCPAGVSPVIKRVGAISGDLIEIRDEGVFLRGRRFQDPAPSVDSLGRTLKPLTTGFYALSSGQLWMSSPHESSWDSRFYGPVSVKDVLGTVEPLWTWSQ